MTSRKEYPSEFFQHLRKGSNKSADQVVPLLMQLFSPSSIVDVGCGTGSWLSRFLAEGVDEVLGLDGEHVPRELLEIPVEQFRTFDLANPVDLHRKFDLVLSLEVAEHLPPEASEIFVDTLVKLGDVIVFSAAVPFQGGDGHVNEQWLDYWVAKFAARGFLAADCLRHRIWTNEEVSWWYAQNSLVFYRPDYLNLHPELEQVLSATPGPCPSAIHPRHYLQIKWDAKILKAALDIVDIIPSGETFVLLDNNQTDYRFQPARKVLKFPTDEEWYWIDPPDEQSAIVELAKLVAGGANFIVIAWPAYWWLTSRKKFENYLHANFGLLLENERVWVFGSRQIIQQRKP